MHTGNSQPVEIPNVFWRHHHSLGLQNLGHQLCQVITLTPDKFFCRDLNVTHETPTSGTLLRKAAATLILKTQRTDNKQCLQEKKTCDMTSGSRGLLTPSFGMLTLLSLPILDQCGTLHVLILCKSTSRSNPNRS